MVTLAERQAARRKAARAKFAAQGKKRATTLSRVAETTAQRRGRGFDPLETVILKSVQPPPPPPPPKPKTICDVLGKGRSFTSGPTVSRGVSFGCGGQPIDFNASSNNTTRSFFGATIAANQAKIRAAGVPFITFAQKQGAKRQIKSIRKKQRSCFGSQAGRRNPQICQGFTKQMNDIARQFGV